MCDWDVFGLVWDQVRALLVKTTLIKCISFWEEVSLKTLVYYRTRWNTQGGRIKNVTWTAGAAVIDGESCQSSRAGGRTHRAPHTQDAVGYRCKYVPGGSRSLFHYRQHNHTQNNRRLVGLRKRKKSRQWRRGFVPWLCCVWVSIPERHLSFLCALAATPVCAPPGILNLNRPKQNAGGLSH